jgi:hypothetical protein
MQGLLGLFRILFAKKLMPIIMLDICLGCRPERAPDIFNLLLDLGTQQVGVANLLRGNCFFGVGKFLG